MFLPLEQGSVLSLCNRGVHSILLDSVVFLSSIHVCAFFFALLFPIFPRAAAVAGRYVFFFIACHLSFVVDGMSIIIYYCHFVDLRQPQVALSIFFCACVFVFDTNLSPIISQKVSTFCYLLFLNRRSHFPLFVGVCFVAVANFSLFFSKQIDFFLSLRKPQVGEKAKLRQCSGYCRRWEKESTCGCHR